MRLPVPGFPGVEVSDRGEIRSRGVVLATTTSDSGYLRVRVTVEGRRRTLFVHVAIALAFHGPRPSPRHRAAHRDGDRLNNVPSNVRWRTALQNEREKREHGTAPSRFSGFVPPAHVVDRARQWTAMGYSYARVGAALGLHRSSVSRIARGLRHSSREESAS